MKRKIYHYTGKSPVNINAKRNRIFIFEYKKALINTLLKNKIITDDKAKELLYAIMPSVFESEYYNDDKR